MAIQTDGVVYAVKRDDGRLEFSQSRDVVEAWERAGLDVKEFREARQCLHQIQEPKQ